LRFLARYMLVPDDPNPSVMTTSNPDANPSATPVLQISGLTKHYGGVKALTGADFRLLPGEHAAIVGDNGAGKSTFVRLITGVEQPNEGRIQLDGRAVSFKSPLDARDQGIETVYQTLALAEDLDVPANIFLGREITRINLGPLSILNHKAMRAQSTAMLATTGVKIQDMSESLRGMSGGQRPRRRFRQEADHSGRAHGRARRGRNRPGGTNHQGPETTGRAAHHHQPQPAPGV
jgi:ABC-type glutathione transport system ATPase component